MIRAATCLRPASVARRTVSARPGVLAVLVLVAGPASFGQQGDVQHVHDPVIAREGDTFFLFATGSRIPCRTSRNLHDWRALGPTLDELPRWALAHVPDAKDRWAPDISFFDGKWHLYYAVSTFGSNQSCIGVATNTTLDRAAPDYRWQDEGLVLASTRADDFNCIDPHVVLDDKGVPWLSFGSFWSGIKIVQLDLRTGKPAGVPVHIAGRHGGPIEAPCIVRHGGWYYLFVSFDHCCRGAESDYKLMVGRSRAVDGPYAASDGRPMTEGGGTLVLAGHGTCRGPGHNGFIALPEGDFVVHHFYDAAHDGVPTLHLRPVIWADDGWPVVGGPHARLGHAGRAPARADVTGRWIHIVDAGSGGPLELEPSGRIGDGNATWSLEGNRLVMRWPRPDAPGGAWIDTCVVAPDGSWYAGRNQVGVLIRGVRP